MIKQRLNQAARALLREFWAKDSLWNCETMSEIDDNGDEVIRLQFRGDFRRSQEVPDKFTSVAKLLPMHFHKALPDTFASKSSDLEFSTKHEQARTGCVFYRSNALATDLAIAQYRLAL